MIRIISRSVGELFITCGLIILLFAAYEVYGKTWETAKEQERLDNALEQMWEADLTIPQQPQSTTAPTTAADPEEQELPTQSTTVQDGDPLTRMHIPHLGMTWVVVEGTTLSDIRFAPGHYRDSALPGQVGNFAVAGHRTPQIFWDLDKMNNGYTIVIEDARHRYIYVVYKKHVVSPSDAWVVAPDPENPGGAPTRSLLTITTCHPKLSNEQRLIVHAELRDTQAK